MLNILKIFSQIKTCLEQHTLLFYIHSPFSFANNELNFGFVKDALRKEPPETHYYICVKMLIKHLYHIISVFFINIHRRKNFSVVLLYRNNYASLQFSMVPVTHVLTSCFYVMSQIWGPPLTIFKKVLLINIYANLTYSEFLMYLIFS